MSRRINRYHGVCQYRNCGKAFVANRRTAKYCNDDCRSLEHQLRKLEKPTPTSPAIPDDLFDKLIERIDQEFDKMAAELRALRIRIERLEQRPMSIAATTLSPVETGGTLDPKMIAEIAKNTHRGVRLEN